MISDFDTGLIGLGILAAGGVVVLILWALGRLPKDKDKDKDQ